MIITAIEGIKIKTFRGNSPPQANTAAGIDTKTENRNIVGDAEHLLLRMPLHVESAMVVAMACGVATKANATGFVGVNHLPGPATLEPFVRNLNLPAMLDSLIKNAKFVANAVARCGDFLGGERFDKTGRQAA